MNCATILFCLFLVNIGGSDGGGEADNANNGKDFVLREWGGKAKRSKIGAERSAAAADDGQRRKGEEADNKFEGNVKTEPMFEEYQKIKKEPKVEEAQNIKKEIKTEPMFEERAQQQQEEKVKANDQKMYQNVKREPKDEEDNNNLGGLVDKTKTEENDWQDGSLKLEKSAAEHCKKSEKEKKLAIKEALITKNNETKLKIIEKFDKMKKEYQKKSNYHTKNRHKIECGIAKELGTCRTKIYEWKREMALARPQVQQTAEDKLKIIEEFEKMKKEYNKRGNYKPKKTCKIEKEIAKELGTCRANIYKLKKQLRRRQPHQLHPQIAKEHLGVTEEFDKIKKEHQKKSSDKAKKMHKIECEIAIGLGTCRTKIYKLKREMARSDDQQQIYDWERGQSSSTVRRYSTEQQSKIIAHFDKLREEFSDTFMMKTNKQIEEKIAKKIGICRRTIYTWKSKNST